MERKNKFLILWIAYFAIFFLGMMFIAGNPSEDSPIYYLIFALIMLIPIFALFFYGVFTGKFKRVYSHIGLGRFMYSMMGAMFITIGAGELFINLYADTSQDSVALGVAMLCMFGGIGAVVIILSSRKEEHKGQQYTPGLASGLGAGLAFTGFYFLFGLYLDDGASTTESLISFVMIIAGLAITIVVDWKWKLTRNSLMGHMIWGEPKG